MAARRMMLPDYGTVSMKGTQYYRTRNGIQINICGSELDDLKRNLTGQMVEKTPNQWWIYFFFHDK